MSESARESARVRACVKVIILRGNQIIARLEKRKLIKQVSSIQNKNRRIYMLFDLGLLPARAGVLVLSIVHAARARPLSCTVPSEKVAGGIFHNEHAELDDEFIESLRQVCVCVFVCSRACLLGLAARLSCAVVTRSWRMSPQAVVMMLRKGTPMTLTEISEAITSSKIARVRPQ